MPGAKTPCLLKSLFLHVRRKAQEHQEQQEGTFAWISPTPMKNSSIAPMAMAFPFPAGRLNKNSRDTGRSICVAHKDTYEELTCEELIHRTHGWAAIQEFQGQQEGKRHSRGSSTPSKSSPVKNSFIAWAGQPNKNSREKEAFAWLKPTPMKLTCEELVHCTHGLGGYDDEPRFDVLAVLGQGITRIARTRHV